MAEFRTKIDANRLKRAVTPVEVNKYYLNMANIGNLAPRNIRYTQDRPNPRRDHKL